MVLAAIMVLQVSAGVEADQVVHQQPQHQKRLDCDSTEENGKWISITHHTRTYKVRLSVMNDDTPPCVGAVNLEFARLTFDDDNNGEPIQVVNEFHKGEHEASDIQIDWLRLEQNGVVVQVCDQTATATNDDGGGCNDGNYSNGDGPCLGFNSIEGHHRAGDETGLCSLYETDRSQSGLESDAAGADDYKALVRFRVRFHNGDLTDWISESIVFHQ